MAAVGQRLGRRLTAGANAVLCFELTDGGALVTDLAGASGTARIRRSTTPSDDAELTALPVELDAESATASLALNSDQTLALAPLAGASVGAIAIVIKVITHDGLIHFHGPADVELWASAL